MASVVYLAISDERYGGSSPGVACPRCSGPGFNLRVFSTRAGAEEYVDEYERSNDKCIACEVCVIILEHLVH